MAIVPVADFTAAHYLCTPAVRAWDEAFMGGSPESKPDLYKARSPITYLEDMVAPQLLLCAERDMYCPPGPVKNYARLAIARDLDVELHVFPRGHGLSAVSDHLTQMRLIHRFLSRVVPPPVPHSSAVAMPRVLLRPTATKKRAPSPPAAPPVERTLEEIQADEALDRILQRAATSTVSEGVAECVDALTRSARVTTDMSQLGLGALLSAHSFSSDSIMCKPSASDPTAAGAAAPAAVAPACYDVNGADAALDAILSSVRVGACESNADSALDAILFRSAATQSTGSELTDASLTPGVLSGTIPPPAADADEGERALAAILGAAFAAAAQSPPAEQNTVSVEVSDHGMSALDAILTRPPGGSVCIPSTHGDAADELSLEQAWHTASLTQALSFDSETSHQQQHRQQHHSLRSLLRPPGGSAYSGLLSATLSPESAPLRVLVDSGGSNETHASSVLEAPPSFSLLPAVLEDPLSKRVDAAAAAVRFNTSSGALLGVVDESVQLAAPDAGVAGSIPLRAAVVAVLVLAQAEG